MPGLLIYVDKSIQIPSTIDVKASIIFRTTALCAAHRNKRRIEGSICLVIQLDIGHKRNLCGIRWREPEGLAVAVCIRSEHLGEKSSVPAGVRWPRRLK